MFCKRQSFRTFYFTSRKYKWELVGLVIRYAKPLRVFSSRSVNFFDVCIVFAVLP